MQTITRSRSKRGLVTVTDGDIGMLSKSFRRSLEAANRSPDTIRIYTISVAQMAEFLADVICPPWQPASRCPNCGAAVSEDVAQLPMSGVPILGWSCSPARRRLLRATR